MKCKVNTPLKSRNLLSVDIRVVNHGSVVLFHPNSDAAHCWMKEHCPPGDEHIYWCSALVVEPRYVEGLIGSVCNDGLNVEGGNY